MPIISFLRGRKSARFADVDSNERLLVSASGDPPENRIAPTIFRRFFTLDNDLAGSSDLRVDGSVNEVVFGVAAGPEDCYISTVSFLLASSPKVEMDLFGGIAALTNGVQFFYTKNNVTVTIDDSLQTSRDFYRLAKEPAFGNKSDVFKVTIKGGTDAYMPFVDLRWLFSLKWGVLLKANSTDRLCLVVRDDLTGLDEFDAIVTGRVI